MKKIFFASLSIFLTTVIFYSCKKNDVSVLTEEQATANLVKSESFVEFSTHFVPDFVNLANYHRPLKMLGNDHEFINAVASTNDDAGLTEAYQKFSLDYATVILLKNHVDNDILTLFNKNPFLLNFSDDQIRKILVTALQSGFTSTDQNWQTAKEEINRRLKMDKANQSFQFEKTINTIGLTKKSGETGLTIDEVWDCVSQAVGFGAAGILGIGGIKEMAKKGLQEVVVTVSKWLAKKAGWVGAAITLIDFGACIYKEANS